MPSSSNLHSCARKLTPLKKRKHEFFDPQENVKSIVYEKSFLARIHDQSRAKTQAAEAAVPRFIPPHKNSVPPRLVCLQTPSISQSFEDELDDACISEAEWDDYEDIMANGTEAEKENYQCWMTHWIEDCDRCSCEGQSGCPDDDPFGN